MTDSTKRVKGRIRIVFRTARLFVMMSVLATGYAMTSTLIAHAEQLGSRSLRIESSVAGTSTRHTFTFSYGAAGTNVGSIVFEYCTSPLLEIACDVPAGLNASTASLAEQSGETGFFVYDQQPNKIILSRTAATSPIANPSQYVFDGVVNPTVQDSFFVRISTHENTDGTGTAVDFGAVANATTQGVIISSEVPPILKFCVGLELGDDCTAANDSVIDLGDLNTSRVSHGSSQMIAATNAEFGLAIAVYGTTMTSGNNVIPALATPTVSAPGNAQFGLNLRDNSNPNTGLEPSGVGLTNPTATYDTPNRYAFSSGDVVATSPAATDTRKLTSSYIVNISSNQAPGIYTATMTYICTATF